MNIVTQQFTKEQYKALYEAQQLGVRFDCWLIAPGERIWKQVPLVDEKAICKTENKQFTDVNGHTFRPAALDDIIKANHAMRIDDCAICKMENSPLRTLTPTGFGAIVAVRDDVDLTNLTTKQKDMK